MDVRIIKQRLNYFASIMRMMADIMIRKRKRLRSKEVKAFAEELRERTGVDVISQDDAVDIAQSSEFDVLFINGDILALIYEGKAFPTVRGMLSVRPARNHVTVDMGAVPFVRNGADIMAPGIVDADPGIKEGDVVWIRDEKNLVPLAVGVSSVAGTELKGSKGKVIKNIHNVGDKLWKVGE